jgi:transcriptional regulator with XRE-family HTH domain
MKPDLSEKYEQLQRLLIQAREEAGLSQQDVAERLGRHQTYISKCERGERRMDLIEFLEIAKAIGFDPQKFIKKLRSI